MFNGKTHKKWQFSIAMLVYQRVTIRFIGQFLPCFSCSGHRGDLRRGCLRLGRSGDVGAPGAPRVSRVSRAADSNADLVVYTQ